MSGIATAIAVGAGATLYSGSQASKASKSAASAQERGADAGIAEQRRQFDITQQNFQPFQDAGVSALEQQRILLGLGSTPQTDPNAARRAELESQISALEGQFGGQSGGQASAKNDTLRGILSVTGGSSMPQQLARSGQGAVSKVMGQVAGNNQNELQRLRSELSSIPQFTPNQVNAQEQQQQAFAAFNESPGQRFLRERQEKSLLRNASAIGGLGGGNVRTALQEQAMGIAQQDFQNQFSRLGQIAGQGQAATTNLGQFGAQSAGNIANLGVAGSQARASGILGAQQARSNTVNQIAGLGGMALGYLNQPQTQFNPSGGMGGFSDERLKENIKEIDRDELGGIYRFNYKSNPDQEYKGRMAQELLDTKPEAVSMHESGFLMVTNEFRPELI